MEASWAGSSPASVGASGLSDDDVMGFLVLPVLPIISLSTSAFLSVVKKFNGVDK